MPLNKETETETCVESWCEELARREIKTKPLTCTNIPLFNLRNLPIWVLDLGTLINHDNLRY